MQLDFSVEKTVKARSSVRAYEPRTLSMEIKEKMNRYINTLDNPFSVNVSFCLLGKETAVNGEKLGTYGTIKGAGDYIGASVKNEDLALEALGYEFEKLILYATSNGLGTCWLGGTFNRGEFANAMNVKENNLFPAISPIGYPLGKKHIRELLIRKIAKSDQRKDWNTIFFNNDFSRPLTQSETGEFAFPLEMLRLAPSASNKQPWRIIQSENAFHFYEEKAQGYDNLLGFDIQRVDLGIAACHFHLAVLEKGLAGKFEKLTRPDIQTKGNVDYIFSWIKE